MNDFSAFMLAMFTIITVPQAVVLTVLLFSDELSGKEYAIAIFPVIGISVCIVIKVIKNWKLNIKGE